MEFCISAQGLLPSIHAPMYLWYRPKKGTQFNTWVRIWNTSTYALHRQMNNSKWPGSQPDQQAEEEGRSEGGHCPHRERSEEDGAGGLLRERTPHRNTPCANTATPTGNCFLLLPSHYINDTLEDDPRTAVNFYKGNSSARFCTKFTLCQNCPAI